jgi:hypothetical protein
MCGYCIEGGVVLYFLECEKASEMVELENNWVSIYLRETENVLGIVSRIKTFDDFSDSIDSAFYRIWEGLVFQQHNNLYNKIIHEFSAESSENFLTKLRNKNDGKAFEALGDTDLYVDSSRWDQFISNKEQLIEGSEEILNDYYNFWLLGSGKEKSDSSEWMVETGIMDPIDNTIPSDWDRFNSSFPMVYFSFLILVKYKSNSKLIKSIALKRPDNCPGFIGNDLWLERKAFIVCVKKHGIQFILDNYNDIRYEQIYYYLLTEPVCVEDLDVLKEKVLSNNQGIYCIDPDSVVELINDLKSKA